MQRLRQLVIIAFCAMLVPLSGAPMGLYWLGLRGVEGRPQKPRELASVEQQEAVWKLVHGTGKPVIEADNPYSYLASVLFGEVEHGSPGNRITWWVARDYLSTHRRSAGLGGWHLSGAALSIWLSRNWSSDEILSRAAQLQSSMHKHDEGLAK